MNRFSSRPCYIAIGPDLKVVAGTRSDWADDKSWMTMEVEKLHR